MKRNLRRLIFWIGRCCALFIIFLVFTFPHKQFNESPPFFKDQILAFDQIRDLDLRKELFIQYLRPYIKVENERIDKQRKRLIGLSGLENHTIVENVGQEDLDWLRLLADEYRLKPGEELDHDILDELIKRVDIIPMDMALAQAASESAWGASRFAQTGNSLFGQWTYSKSNGIIPLERAEGATHQVARFSSVQESVRSYMRNLNTHWAYQPFRSLRSTRRLNGESLDAYDLAVGIERYSERRKAYVKDIQRIIQQIRNIKQNAL